MSIVARANEAISNNPSTADVSITTHGSDWLWAVFAVMLITDFVVFAWQFSFPRGQRVFHQLALVSILSVTLTTCP